VNRSRSAAFEVLPTVSHSTCGDGKRHEIAILGDNHRARIMSRNQNLAVRCSLEPEVAHRNCSNPELC
jgi:hypothetical protein